MNDSCTPPVSPTAGVADLERALSRLHAVGVGGGTGRDAPHVVLYEDAARRRVRELTGVLRGLQRLQDAVREFAGASCNWCRCTIVGSLCVAWRKC